MSELDLLRQIDRLERRLAALETLERPLQLVAPFLGWPNIRALWPMTSIDESGNIIDISGQGRTLTNVGSTPAVVESNRIPCLDLNGSTQYAQRTDEVGLDITTGLTVAGVYLADALGADQTLISKWNTTGNQRAWLLNIQASNLPAFTVSVDGAATTASPSTVSVLASNWYFVIGRFTPSASLDICVNGVWSSNTTSIPATIADSSAALIIGARNAGASTFLNGRAAITIVCATPVPDAICSATTEAIRGMFGV